MLPELLQRALDEPPTDGELTLRPLRSDDLERLVELLQDPEIPRWTRVPSPYAMSDALSWFGLQRSEAEARTALHLVIADPDDRQVGTVGFPVLDLDRGFGEIGYWVARDVRGRGISPRAIGLLVEWSRRALGLRDFEILPHRDNAPSCRAAEKAGFAFTGAYVAVPRITDEPEYAQYRLPGG